MRKGQMEAFGLAVIVILIALGILFTLQFTVLAPKQEVRKPFVEQQLASNLLGAILVTSVTQDCPQAKDFTDLFTDYARCDATLYCGNEVSYAYFNRTLANILDQTLSPANKRYKLEICVVNPTQCLLPPCVIIEKNFEQCGDITPARFFLPLGSGFPTANVDLKICS